MTKLFKEKPTEEDVHDLQDFYNELRNSGLLETTGFTLGYEIGLYLEKDATFLALNLERKVKKNAI